MPKVVMTCGRICSGKGTDSEKIRNDFDKRYFVVLLTDTKHINNPM